MTKMKILLMIAVISAGAAALLAQTPPAAPSQSATTTAATNVPDGDVPAYIKPETPEQRMKRLGMTEDPGVDPDPKKHYWRYGQSFYIEKFDRKWASYEDVDPGSVRPFAYVNATNEIYQQNEKYVWVWVRDVSPEDLPKAEASPRYNNEQLRYLEGMRSEFSELTPKASEKTIRFTPSSDGLPNSGSWRNSLAVGDMNGDGCPDIIAPPERKLDNMPAIFLGDCKGHWTFWRDVKWPHPLDYGNVVAADFNKDGHLDLAFGVHLKAIFVFLGDGKGNFTEVSRGLPRAFATRRVAVADVDRDGYPDIVAITEGISAGPEPVPLGRVRAYLNRHHGSAWEEKDVANRDLRVGGDWVTVASLMGKKYPDVIASSIFANSNQIVYLSDGPDNWKLFADDGQVVPFLSYYSANAAGKFSSKKVDDAIVSYSRFWPGDLNTTVIPDPPQKMVIGIDRISFAGGEPKRTPIVRWGGTRNIGGVAVGDFDGDGNLDIIYTRHDPREAVILLGDGKGRFTRANIEGLTLKPNTNYDITVADVNRDGKPDVIVMYESSAKTVLAVQDGAIEVFLNRGVVPATVEANH